MLRFVVASYLLSCASFGYSFHIKLPPEQVCVLDEKCSKNGNIDISVNNDANISVVTLKYQLGKNYNEPNLHREFFSSSSVRNTFITVDELEKICKQFKRSLPAVADCSTNGGCVTVSAIITPDINKTEVRTVLEKYFIPNKHIREDERECTAYANSEVKTPCNVNSKAERCDEKNDYKHGPRKSSFCIPFFNRDNRKASSQHMIKHGVGNYRTIHAYWEPCEFYDNLTAVHFTLMAEALFSKVLKQRVKCFFDKGMIVLLAMDSSITYDDLVTAARNLFENINENDELFRKAKARAEKRLRRSMLGYSEIDYDDIVAKLKQVFAREPLQVVIEPNRNSKDVFVH